METKVIKFIDIGVAEYGDIAVKEPGDNDVVVNMSFTTISNGTERENLMGVNCNARSKYDPGEKPGGFPRICGYSGSGIVEWAGRNVTAAAIGDRVVASSGFHMKHLVRNEKLVTKIPDSLTLESAAICHIANFPLGGVRKAEVEIGESALVVGLGILGIFSIQFMKCCGAYPVIAADFNEERRRLALEFGADYALDPGSGSYIEDIRRITEGRMINAAVEVTGSGAALDRTLDCMTFFGRISLLGCTRNPNFTIDYYRKVHYPGIKLIGAHAGARPKEESHRDHWTEKDDIETVIRLAAADRIKLGELVRETHSPTEAKEVYARLAADKDFPVCVQFDWRNVK